MEPTREETYCLFKQYNNSDALLLHALQVEGVMRYFARLYGENEEKWGIVGLLHDVDYEMYPEDHCIKAAEILKEHDIPENYIHAVVSHGYGICSDVEPQHLMEKVLYAIDELTGLIHATALMRPSRSVMDLEYKSLNKKYKTTGFAAGVNRRIIEKGVAMLEEVRPEVNLQFIMEQSILGMREVEKKLNERLTDIAGV